MRVSQETKNIIFYIPNSKIMKKFFYLVITTVIFAFSCSTENSSFTDENNASTNYPEDGVVRIATTLNDMQTRSGESTSQYEGTSLALFLDYGDDDPCTLENNEWTQSNNVWSSSEPSYWKGQNEVVDIYAYAPYVADQTINSVSFSVAEDQRESGALIASDFITYKQAGVVPADDLEDKSFPITFNHVLTQLNITFNIGSEFAETPTVTQVTVMAKKSIDYNLSTQSITSTSDYAEIIATEANGQFQVLIAPEAVLSGEMFIDVQTDSYSFAYTPSEDITFESGVAYNIELNLGKDAVQLSNVNVVNWDDPNDLGSFDTEITTQSYKVADLYPNDTDPVGVVYSVSHNGTHGYVVSIDQSEDSEWYTGLSYLDGATSETDGMANTSIIMREIESYPDYYPLFTVIKEKNLARYPNLTYEDYVSGATDIWYLPSIAELEYLYSVVDKINSTGTAYQEISDALTSCDGMQFNKNFSPWGEVKYYSSTETSSSTVYFANFAKVNSSRLSTGKAHSSYISRAILKF